MNKKTNLNMTWSCGGNLHNKATAPKPMFLQMLTTVQKC